MCFTKFSILIMVSSQKRHIGNYCLFLPLYLYRFNHFSLFFDNLWTEGTEGIIKLVAVVNMILNFLITDKSIMAEMLNHFSLFIKDLGTEGEGEVGMIQGRVRSLFAHHSIQFSKMQLIGPKCC